MISDRPVLIPLVGIVVLSFVLRKRWRLGSYFLQAILAEVLTYGLVTRFIERRRPEPVEQLDKFNLLHSFPSGHVAASVAVYGSLGLLLAAHFKNIWARVAIWTVAVGIHARRRDVARLPGRAPSHRRRRRGGDGNRRDLCCALRSAHGPQGRGVAPPEACRAARGGGRG